MIFSGAVFSSNIRTTSTSILTRPDKKEGREACRWYVSLVADSDVPKHLLALLKCWSPTRDAWMRSVVRAPQLP
jgi:hypothetical protein